MPVKPWSVAATAVLCAVGTAPAFAHHAANAQFDVTKKIVMQGTLSRVLDVNPHAYWFFYVKQPDGKLQEWALESAAPNAWRRAGLRMKEDVKVGDTYSFEIAPGLLPGKSIGLMMALKVQDHWITLMGPKPKD